MTSSFGPLLKEWRRHRRVSQLDLAADAGISQKHLSFMESGRSTPSRAMVLKLADHLEVPLREQNDMLIAAGLSPEYRERGVEGPGFDVALEAARHVLAGHEPYPAIAVDRHWTLIAANRAAGLFFDLVSEPGLLAPPANVLRASLHPNGLARHILNLPAWRAHLLHRLDAQIRGVPDPQLSALRKEMAAYPLRGAPQPDVAGARPPDLAVALELSTGEGVLRFVTTVTVFGAALDVTLSELALETFFPADDFTREALRGRDA